MNRLFAILEHKRELSHLVAQVAAFLLLLLMLGILLAGCGNNTPATTPGATTTSTTSASVTTAGTTPATAAPGAATTPAVIISTTAPVNSIGGTVNDNTTPTPGVTVPASIQPAFQSAMTDLVARTQVPVASIKLLGYQQEQFNDGSLGCPQPGVMYAQVLTPGYILRFQVGEDTYEYHTSLNGSRAVLCDPNQQIKPPSNP